MSDSEIQQNWLNERSVLISSIFIAGLCSIVYELLISTTSSYFLGDSVTQFSLTIGFYMAAMGIGSYISRLFQENLLQKFIGIEIILGLIGGASVPLLYLIYAHTGYGEFMFYMLSLVVIIGILTGLEIPLLTRILKVHYPLKINLSNVLSMDYFGALLATLLFPFFLLPMLGTFKTSILFGLVNVSLGFLNLWFFSEHIGIKKKRILYAASTFVTVFFVSLFYLSNVVLDHWNNALYTDNVIYSKQTPYQNIILTKGKKDISLYLNGNIQFSSMDEYRYHESLVHIPMANAFYKKNILILGGGEGLVAREVLKHAEVERITIVDLDPAMFELSTTNRDIVNLNKGSLTDPRVRLEPMDAYVFLQETTELFDVIIGDLPEPSNESLSRLYSREFYKLVKSKLVPQGVFVTQATGPYHTLKAFHCIQSSIKAGGFAYIYPYHAYVPSFGDWGFVMAANRELDITKLGDEEMKFLDKDILGKLFLFEKDLQLDSLPYSTLVQPILLEYYMEGWRKWGQNK